MNEDDFIIVSAILFCLVTLVTCAGVCSSMREHAKTEAHHAE